MSTQPKMDDGETKRVNENSPLIIVSPVIPLA
jgi:hypothetical protein